MLQGVTDVMRTEVDSKNVRNKGITGLRVIQEIRNLKSDLVKMERNDGRLRKIQGSPISQKIFKYCAKKYSALGRNLLARKKSRGPAVSFGTLPCGGPGQLLCINIILIS